MKIYEITEAGEQGFGQWFRRGPTGGDGNAVGNAARAVAGAGVRQAKDMARGALGKMGFAGAAEKQKMQRIAGGIAKNFSRYIAQRGLDQNTAAVQQYLTDLGFNASDIEMTSGGQAWAESKLDEVNPAAMQAQAQKKQAPAQQAPAQQAPDDDSKPEPVNRNELITTIANTVRNALKNNRVPKAIEKFTKI